MGRFFVTAKKHKALQAVCDRFKRQRDEHLNALKQEITESRRIRRKNVQLDEEIQHVIEILVQSDEILAQSKYAAEMYEIATKELAAFLTKLNNELSPLLFHSMEAIQQQPRVHSSKF